MKIKKLLKSVFPFILGVVILGLLPLEASASTYPQHREGGSTVKKSNEIRHMTAIINYEARYRGAALLPGRIGGGAGYHLNR